MTKSGGKERVGVGKPLAFWETTNTFIAKGDLDFIQESNRSKEPIWVRFQGTEKPTKNYLNKERVLSHITRCTRREWPG